MFLMFEEKTNKVAWTLLVFFGWLLVAFSSQIFSINDATITVIRHMADLRLLRVIIVIVGYSLLVLFKYDWKKIIYLFFVGFLIHFMMEFSLLVSGIRPGSFLILIENSLIEFNMGVPFFYLLYDKYLQKKIK
jgi:mannose/fructose/N-acetylgalactosamine-specific phosphotransferase system component IIC